MPSVLNHPAASLLVLILFRVTLLLAIAWSLHWMLRGKNPRWQVSLWRATIFGIAAIMLCSAWHRGWGPKLWFDSTATRFAASAAFPQVTVTPVQTVAANSAELDTEESQAARSPGSGSWKKNASATPFQVSDDRAVASVQHHMKDIVAALSKFYIFVAGILLLRLLLRIVRVSAMLRRAEPAGQRLIDLVSTLATQLGLGRIPRVLVSSATAVPLATGLIRPVILLPTQLSQTLGSQESRFVLTHECSHFKGRDLPWALAVRLVQILLWPHPLAWGLASAHRYACDLRCDAVAASEQPASYSSMLAAMAIDLNRSALPPTAMAFLQRSEVIGRVRQIEAGIGAERPSRVRRAFSALGAVAVIGVAGTIGVNATFPVNLDEIDHLLVKVVDNSREPIAGARIKVQGLRTRKEAASAYGNIRLTDWETDTTGIANVAYPKYVYEEMETGQLIINVTHCAGQSRAAGGRRKSLHTERARQLDAGGNNRCDDHRAAEGIRSAG